MSYLDAMLYHADENGLESETVAGLVNVKTKTKLREEAERAEARRNEAERVEAERKIELLNTQGIMRAQ